MLILVTGGSGSGKSAFAESRVLQLPGSRRVYLASMEAGDEESRARIQRHRQMRAGKGFITVECPYNLSSLSGCAGSVVLLEDLSNLLANEMFSRPDPSRAGTRIWEGLEHLWKSAAHLVVVTNEVFSDGNPYTEETEAYLQNLGILNRRLAAVADEFYEIVYGIPVKWFPADGMIVNETRKQ